MASKFLAQVAKCPFCGNRIEKPEEMEPRRLGDFSYGTCMCGAVYVCDETGHNIGAAMIEALGFACKDDWDLAWALMPDEDYRDVQIEKYDIQTNMIYPSGKTSDGRFVRGVLVFIRLNDELLEAQGQNFISKVTLSEPVITKTVNKTDKIKRRFKKSEVEKLVKECNTEKLCEMVLQDALVLRKIQRLLYSADEKTRWNAVLCLGKSAGALVKLKPEVVGDLVRRLLYAANDSAAASWGALEAVGEIIRWSADVFGSFVRHMLAMLRDPQLRPAVLWSAGRIGQRHPELIKSSAFFAIFDCLHDKDPKVRGYAVWTLGNLKAREAQNSITRLITDNNKITIFDGQKNIETTIGDLAQEALEKIEQAHKEKPMETPKDNKKEQQQGQKAQPQQEALAAAYQLYREADLAKARGMSLEALDKYKEALPIFEYYKKDVEIANCCEKLADVLLMRGDFKGALPLYQRAMAICEKKHDAISLLILIEKIIDIYRHFKDQEKLLTYLFKALELCEQLKDASRAGLYLTTIGDIYQKQGRLDDALDAYRVALKLYKGMKSRERVEILQKGIAEIEAQLVNED